VKDAPGFTLTKWYLDCATADGRAVIAYWASLTWLKLSVTWQNVSWFEPQGARSQRSSLAKAPPPQVLEDAITWPATLGGEIRIEQRAGPVEARLYESENGLVDWRTEAPAAMVRATFPAFGTIEGPGYVERIVMTVPPWRLPIRELRWGRWIDAAAARSVVWIDWRGSAPQTRVFVDGICARNPVVTDDCVSAGTARLTIGDRLTLHQRALGDIVATIPPLRAALPATLLALRQSKWCGNAVLTNESEAPITGRTIHEVVIFG
jgi:hypothetical protein